MRILTTDIKSNLIKLNKSAYEQQGISTVFLQSSVNGITEKVVLAVLQQLSQDKSRVFKCYSKLTFWTAPRTVSEVTSVTTQMRLPMYDSFTYIHTYIHPFNGPLPGTTRVSRYQKVKPIWILLKQETVSGSGISWATCKSVHSSRQTTTPAPHHSVFLQAWCPSCHPTNSIKALKATIANYCYYTDSGRADSRERRVRRRPSRSTVATSTRGRASIRWRRRWRGCPVAWRSTRHASR